MTDARAAGLAREVLATANPFVSVDGFACEVLLTTPTAAEVAGLVREVLGQFPARPAGGQVAVSINTS